MSSIFSTTKCQLRSIIGTRYVPDNILGLCSPTQWPMQLPLFSCAIVLLLNVWGNGKRGSSTDPVKEMEEVYKAMRMLKVLEPRFVYSLHRYSLPLTADNR